MTLDAFIASLPTPDHEARQYRRTHATRLAHMIEDAKAIAGLLLPDIGDADRPAVVMQLVRELGQMQLTSAVDDVARTIANLNLDTGADLVANAIERELAEAVNNVARAVGS